MADTYGINFNFTGPAGWSQEYTTVNGTFPAGHVDSVQVNSGDTTTISVSINPNGIDGFYGMNGYAGYAGVDGQYTEQIDTSIDLNY